MHLPALTQLYLTPSDVDELHVSNVTSSSLKLRWTSPDSKLFVYFEVVVTRLHDHALVLKTNVSGHELSLDNLESAQTYHAVVNAYTAEGQIVSTLKGIMTTSKSKTHLHKYVLCFLFIPQDNTLFKRAISNISPAS